MPSSVAKVVCELIFCRYSIIVSATYIALAIYREREKKRIRIWELTHDILMKHMEKADQYNYDMNDKEAMDIVISFYHLQECVSKVANGNGNLLIEAKEKRCASKQTPEK